jgi:molybdopterin-guanine dinucleotide biosynthesis protein A
MTSPPLIVGIFVGGASRRMGRPKGLLPAPGAVAQTLVERLAKECESALGSVPLLLVGQRDEYEALGLPTLADARSGSGPLGGLVALLGHAESVGADTTLALACDLPYVSRELIERLAHEAPHETVLAPRTDGYWQPLAARYRVRTALPVARATLDAGRLSLQNLLNALGAEELPLSPEEELCLRDWDSPEDVTR